MYASDMNVIVEVELQKKVIMRNIIISYVCVRVYVCNIIIIV